MPMSSYDVSSVFWRNVGLCQRIKGLSDEDMSKGLFITIKSYRNKKYIRTNVTIEYLDRMAEVLNVDRSILTKDPITRNDISNSKYKPVGGFGE